MKNTGICRKALSETLEKLAEHDERIVVLTSDARNSVTLSSYAEKFPEQFIETGIAEQNEIGVAAGMALSGAIPFVCAPAAFLTARGLEQIKVDVCYNNANVKLCGVSGGLAYGESGETHFAIHDIGTMIGFHNLTVIFPSDAVQTEWAVRQMAQMETPVYLRVGRNEVPTIYEKGMKFKIGKACSIHKGTDVTVIAAGEAVHVALEAARKMEQAGISVRVLDMHTLKPLDEEAIVKAAGETGGILTVEEHMEMNGLGSAVARVVCTHMPVPMRMIGIPDKHIACGNASQLQKQYGLDVDLVMMYIKELLQEKEKGRNERKN